eukprot:1696311-Pleurochrysis_carterae.AAC.5
MYVQYESLRRGYIDDVEFALAKGIVNVRTSSRVGYLDLGVNAKRCARSSRGSRDRRFMSTLRMAQAIVGTRAAAWLNTSCKPHDVSFRKPPERGWP